MKIVWNGRDQSGRFSFSASPGEYDATPPVDQLFLDRDMLVVNNDVLGLSGFLAFAPFCSGTVSLPRSVSPEMVRAIESYAEPSWIHVTSVDLEPREAPKGEGYAYLRTSLDICNRLPNEWGMPRNSTISIADASEWSGYLVSSEMLIVGSNAKTLSAFFPPGSEVLPYVAAAILYMESLRCSTLVIPDAVEIDEFTWARLSRLLSACKYALLRENDARVLLEARRAEILRPA